MFDCNNPNTMWNNGWQIQPNPTPSINPNINTNVLRVTSLDEAIMKTNARNSEMAYFHQSKDEFYVVRVDMNGNKSWYAFTYAAPNPTANIPVMRADFDALSLRLEVLESKFKEVKNEPDGQNAVQ